MQQLRNSAYATAVTPDTTTNIQSEPATVTIPIAFPGITLAHTGTNLLTPITIAATLLTTGLLLLTIFTIRRRRKQPKPTP